MMDLEDFKDKQLLQVPIRAVVIDTERFTNVP
jgi:hypothetical protein